MWFQKDEEGEQRLEFKTKSESIEPCNQSQQRLTPTVSRIQLLPIPTPPSTCTFQPHYEFSIFFKAYCKPKRCLNKRDPPIRESSLSILCICFYLLLLITFFFPQEIGEKGLSDCHYGKEKVAQPANGWGDCWRRR